MTSTGSASDNGADKTKPSHPRITTSSPHTGSASDNSADETKASHPRITTSSLHTALPSQTDYAERQRIAQCFSPTAFAGLASLPDDLHESNVLAALESKALATLATTPTAALQWPEIGETARSSSAAAAAGTATGACRIGSAKPPFKPAGAPMIPSTKPARLFHDFEHMHSSFTLIDDLTREEVWDREAKTVGGPFVPAGSAYKCKHENMLAWQAGSFAYPTLAVGDPFDPPPHECQRRRAVAAEKILNGAFKPAGRRKGYAGLTRRMLPDIVRALHKRLLRDWSDVAFAVLATEDDMVVARFALSKPLSTPALRSYMNALARAPGELGQQFGLHVALDDWNRSPGDGYVYFMLRPSWVPARRVGGEGDADDNTLKASSTFSMISGQEGSLRSGKCR